MPPILRDASGAEAALSSVPPWAGWALPLAAVAAGWLGYGWIGLALAITVIVFWLLLQFSRALRALRDAAGRPIGQVPNAVMLHSRIERGMRLPQVLKLTRSLGEKLTAEHESFVWRDAAGDTVRVELQGGRVTAWQLSRAPADSLPPPREEGDAT